MIGLWKEFRAFAFKGNMIDLAVAVVIGAAFAKIVTSLVDNVIMPVLSYVTPDQGYQQWMIGRIRIGAFLGDVVTFLILALAVFIVIVKVIGWMTKRGKAEAAAPMTKDQQLLTEIRDLLRK